MKYISNYFCDNEEDRKLFTQLNASTIAEKLDITTRELAHKVLIFPKKLAEVLKISEDAILDIIFEHFHKDLSDLIEFSVCGKEETLYKRDAIYIEKCNASTQWHKIKQFFNVYIVEKEYADLISGEVAQFVLSNQYPHIFKNPKFIKIVNRFNNDNIFSLKLGTKLKDIDTILMRGDNLEYLDYTIQDLIDVITNPHGYEKTKKESLFNIYAQSYSKEYVSIFLELDKNISLTIPIETLQSHDWSIIEEAKVYNIPCYPNEKRWFTGKQKNAPYFNHPLINELKRIIQMFSF